jgi:hypothetical protein
MSKEALVILLGAFTALLPFMGLPSSWRTVLMVLCGASLVLIGVLLRSETLSRGDSRGSSFFVDNRSRSESQTFEESAPPQRIQ